MKTISAKNDSQSEKRSFSHRKQEGPISDPRTKPDWSRTERFGPGPRTGPDQDRENFRNTGPTRIRGESIENQDQ